MRTVEFGNQRYLPYIVTCQKQQQRYNSTENNVSGDRNISFKHKVAYRRQQERDNAIDRASGDHNITLEHIMRIRRFGWSSPIVVEKYKLVFMPVAKSGCSQWKRLFQRIQNIDSTDIHDPDKNKLKYLMYRSDEDIRKILLDPSWTKATMVREPRSRLLSGYHHVKDSKWIEHMLNRTWVTFEDLVYHVKYYPNSNEHLEPQAYGQPF